ncbi:MAG: hypothetical protein ABSG80_08370 [Verrucomicrobiota bacterium]|jgi:hypothetical protein
MDKSAINKGDTKRESLQGKAKPCELTLRDKLTPLGEPAPNAPKWFAAVEMIRLAADQDWLHKATKEISKYWRQKRERCRTSEPLSRTARLQTA